MENLGKVLVVDDNEDVLFALNLLLEPYAEKIRVAKTPEKIDFFMKEYLPDITLLAMNFRKDAISGQEGFEWLEKILKMDKDAVVILMTAYSDTEKAVRAIKSGATDFITKPWENEKLLATLSSGIKLRRSRKEVDTLEEQVAVLANGKTPLPQIIGESEAICRIFSTAEKLGSTDANVLLLGENGTGKDLIAQLLHSSCAVAAADDGHGAGLGQSLGHSAGTAGEILELKHAHGAVPHHGAGIGHGGAETLTGSGADIHALHLLGDGSGGHHGADSGGGELGRSHGVGGQQQIHAIGLSLGDHLQSVLQTVVLAQALADGTALSLDEGVGHTAADDQGVGLVQQVVDHADLGGNLGTAQNGDQRTLGVGQSAADEVQFLLDQEAGNGRQVSGHTGGGGVSTMDGTEGVGDIQLSHVGQFLGHSGVVLLLAGIEAQVLQQHDLAALEGCGLSLGILAHDIGSENHLAAQQLAQTLGHDSQRELLLPLTLGLAQVGAGDNGSTVVQQVLDGGQGGHDAVFIGDDTVLQRHVEIATHQYALAGHVQVFYSLFAQVTHNKTSFQNNLSVKKITSQHLYYIIV